MALAHEVVCITIKLEKVIDYLFLLFESGRGGEGGRGRGEGFRGEGEGRGRGRGEGAYFRSDRIDRRIQLPFVYLQVAAVVVVVVVNVQKKIQLNHGYPSPN